MDAAQAIFFIASLDAALGQEVVIILYVLHITNVALFHSGLAR